MSTSADLRTLLLRQGLLLEGHYLLGGNLFQSHLCVNDYVLKEEILLRPQNLDLFGRLIASFVPDDLLTPDVPIVVGIERGGRILSSSIALHLAQRLGEQANRLVCITARRASNRFVVERREESFLAKHTRAIVVEDFLVKGQKVSQTIDLIRPYDIKVAAVLALGQRGTVKGTTPVFSALALSPALEYADCPSCTQGEEPEHAPQDWYPEEK